MGESESLALSSHHQSLPLHLASWGRAVTARLVGNPVVADGVSGDPSHKRVAMASWHPGFLQPRGRCLPLLGSQ